MVYRSRTFLALLLITILALSGGCRPYNQPAVPAGSLSLTQSSLSPSPVTLMPESSVTLLPESSKTPVPLVEATLSAMSLEQKIGQTMLIGFDGLSVDDDLRQLISENHIGGVILFSRNIESPAQVARLTNEIQRIALESGNPGLFVAVDQEGGRVARLTLDTGFTEFPGAMAVAATGDPENAYRVATAMAVEMRAVGINADFAPDLDVNNNPSNPVIGIRSFSSDPQTVVEYGLAFARGLQENGVLAFGKHFPGHGDTGVDSHIALPLVPYDRARLNQIELVPFRAAIAADIAGIMSAHVTFPAIDPTPGLAATLSRPVLTGLLRQELGYNGLIVTDSLEMGALAANGYPPQVGAPMAQAAGADLLLFNRDYAMHRETYANLLQAARDGKVSMEQLDASVLRILKAKERFALLRPTLVDPDGVAGFVKTPEHLALAQMLSERSMTLVRDLQHVLPLSQDKPVLIVETSPLRGLTGDLVPGGTIMEVDAQPTAGQIADVLQAAADLRPVVVGVNDLDQNPKQVKLIKELLEAGNPVIAIAFRNPFDARLLPDEVSVLVTYGFNWPVRQALSDVLTGKAQAPGVLPVTFP